MENRHIVNVVERQPSIFLTLPVGPGVNEKYVSRRFVLTDKYRKYMQDVYWICQQQKVKPLEGDLKVTIHWYRMLKNNRFYGDIDSKIKCLLDALEGSCYKNDSQIAELSIKRINCASDPKMEVFISEVE